MRPLQRLLRFSCLFFFLSAFTLMSRFHLEFISENMMYPNQNLSVLMLSAFFCGVCVFIFHKKVKQALALGLLALLLGESTVIPFSEVDQLFYGQLQKIQDESEFPLLADKIELCDHVKSNYLNLKPQMILELDRVCAGQVLKIAQRSKTELTQAFNWAYAEYARRPQAFQVIALACLYAETNQKDFAVELAEKHQFTGLEGALKTSGRCPIFINRQIASVKDE